MTSLLDQLITFSIVLVAVLYIVWRLVLPVRVKVILRAKLRGEEAPCEPDAQTSGCAGGCSGCALANEKKKV